MPIVFERDMKDKNGVVLQEGDIFLLHKRFYKKVEYWNGALCYQGGLGYETFLYKDSDNIEVVGNERDTPELLEKIK